MGAVGRKYCTDNGAGVHVISKFIICWLLMWLFNVLSYGFLGGVLNKVSPCTCKNIAIKHMNLFPITLSEGFAPIVIFKETFFYAANFNYIFC